MLFGNNDLHAKMAAAQDTDGDGQISPQEAAAYVQQYLQQASPEDRSKMLQDYLGQLSPEQKSAMGTALVESPANPVTAVDPSSDSALADALTQTAHAPATASGQSPLEAAFAHGGLLSSPLVKVGLVGLAGVIGSRLLRH
ncbi:hypothetical protein [Deinococcus sp.]|uniref:hypothetical protein n=1 Tax=Deinococcus sp. TaxID=47478 RepID=UPI003CC6208C